MEVVVMYGLQHQKDGIKAYKDGRYKDGIQVFNTRSTSIMSLNFK
jgi:hypothetical protein